jgi:hypothetical protein
MQNLLSSFSTLITDTIQTTLSCFTPGPGCEPGVSTRSLPLSHNSHWHRERINAKKCNLNHKSIWPHLFKAIGSSIFGNTSKLETFTTFVFKKVRPGANVIKLFTVVS